MSRERHTVRVRVSAVRNWCETESSGRNSVNSVNSVFTSCFRQFPPASSSALSSSRSPSRSSPLTAHELPWKVSHTGFIGSTVTTTHNSPASPFSPRPLPSTDEVAALVIDNGSGMCKAGVSTTCSPLSHYADLLTPHSSPETTHPGP